MGGSGKFLLAVIMRPREVTRRAEKRAEARGRASMSVNMKIGRDIAVQQCDA